MSWAASCAPRCGREAASSATISRVTPDFAAPIGTPPVVQGDGKNAERLLPIVYVPFSDVKTWLNGTYHGVSAKHLARYAREWTASTGAHASPTRPTPCSSAPWPDRPSPTGSRSTVYNRRARYLP